MISVIALALLASCNGNRAECDVATPCTGFGETCVQGQCIAGACATSAQCPMEHYCEDRECAAGCALPSDCYPGYTCDTELGTCVEDRCIDTSVDCGFREFCNVATGDCYDAGDSYCRFCDDDSECGDGNFCLWHYCGVDCSGGRECPAGFECYPVSDEFGNPAGEQCLTYCWLFEDYEPGSFSVQPPFAIEGVTVTRARAVEAGAAPEKAQ